MHSCICMDYMLDLRSISYSLSGAEPHSGLGGPWPLQKKKKKFPLDYEEKINGPPNIRQPAPLPISHPFSQPSIKN